MQSFLSSPSFSEDQSNMTQFVQARQRRGEKLNRKIQNFTRNEGKHKDLTSSNTQFLDNIREERSPLRKVKSNNSLTGLTKLMSDLKMKDNNGHCCASDLEELVSSSSTTSLVTSLEHSYMEESPQKENGRLPEDDKSPEYVVRKKIVTRITPKKVVMASHLVRNYEEERDRERAPDFITEFDEENGTLATRKKASSGQNKVVKFSKKIGDQIITIFSERVRSLDNPEKFEVVTRTVITRCSISDLHLVR